MSRYMIQASYTADAVASMVKHPEDRSEAVRPVVEQLGGKLLEFYFTLGDYDTILIVELPNNTAALAAALACIVPGHLATIRTTALLTPEETVMAMKEAGVVSLRAPGP